jgi:hypothetical protein
MEIGLRPVLPFHRGGDVEVKHLEPQQRIVAALLGLEDDRQKSPAAVLPKPVPLEDNGDRRRRRAGKPRAGREEVLGRDQCPDQVVLLVQKGASIK